MLDKNSVINKKKLPFCPSRGNIRRSRSPTHHVDQKKICLPREKAGKSGLPHEISLNLII